MKGTLEIDRETGKITITKEFPQFTLILWKYPDVEETHLQYIYNGDVPSEDTIQLFVNANIERFEIEDY